MGLHALIKGWGGVIIAVLVVVGCASTPMRRSTGEVIDDAVITTKVKTSLIADPAVSALAISVDTSKGVVSLTGIVNSEQERHLAMRLAREVAGVTWVDARNLFVKR